MKIKGEIGQALAEYAIALAVIVLVVAFGVNHLNTSMKREVKSANAQAGIIVGDMVGNDGSFDNDTSLSITNFTINYDNVKKSYVVGDALDFSGLEVFANYSDGSSSNITKSCIAKADLSTVGTKNASVIYRGNSIGMYLVSVVDDLMGITFVADNAKKEYYIGDALVKDGLIIQAAYVEGGVQDISAECTLKGSTAVDGKQTVSVVYNGRVVGSYEISVIDPYALYCWYDSEKATLHLSHYAITGDYVKTTTFSAYSSTAEVIVVDNLIKPKNMEGWFTNYRNLTTIDFKDNVDTSDVTSMIRVFYNCNNVETIKLGSKFNTSKVTDMNMMFNNCYALKSLDLGDNFDTSSVTNMYCMFYGCGSLESLDFGDKFDTSNVLNMTQMFYGCRALSKVAILEDYWDSIKGRVPSGTWVPLSEKDGNCTIYTKQ